MAADDDTREAVPPRREPRRSPSTEDRQRDAERTRQSLLAAAAEEFASKGYAGARVQDIAARAGVNKQLITYYFGGKEGLYREIQSVWEAREAGFNQPDVPMDELIERYLRHVLADPRIMRLFVWRELEDAATETTDDATDATDATDAAAEPREDLSGIRARQERGEIAPDLDPGAFVLTLIGAVAAPVIMPRLTRRYCGIGPEDPGFADFYAEQLRRIVSRLAVADPILTTP